MKKIILNILTSIAIYTIIGLLIELVLVQLYATNAYLRDALFYLLTPVFATGITIYYFYVKKKETAIGFIIGFTLYYLSFWIAHLWGMGEAAECTNYFFNLMSNCS